MPSAGALAATGHLPNVGPLPAWTIVGAVGTLGEVCGGLLLYYIGWYGGCRSCSVRQVRHFREPNSNACTRSMKSTVARWCSGAGSFRSCARRRIAAGHLADAEALLPHLHGTRFGDLCFGLAGLGDEAGHNVDAITAYVHDFALAIVGGVVLVIVAAIVVWRIRRANRAPAPPAAQRQTPNSP